MVDNEDDALCDGRAVVFDRANRPELDSDSCTEVLLRCNFARRRVPDSTGEGEMIVLLLAEAGTALKDDPLGRTVVSTVRLPKRLCNREASQLGSEA